jgi:DNA-directed RNA polymerase specialized sigma subunit
MKSTENKKTDSQILFSKVCKTTNKIPHTVSRSEVFLTAWKIAKNDRLEIKAVKKQKIKEKAEFDSYVNMIRMFAWKYAKKYHMDYEDVEAQGFFIYSMAVSKYHKGIASFSTYLYINLNGRLRDYCKSITTKKALDIAIGDVVVSAISGQTAQINAKRHIDFDDIFIARENGLTKEQLLSYAECCLSINAYKVLEYLLHDSLLGFKSKTNPSLNLLSKKLNIDLLALKLAWQELIDFWDCRGAAFYAES